MCRIPTYRVVWRIDGDSVCNHTHAPAQRLCAHVRNYAWIPQQALLAHSSTRLLVTHGGINSVIEASTHGVPMIGECPEHVRPTVTVIPMFADQFPNAARVEQWGTGRMITKNQVGTHLADSLRAVLADDRYAQRIGAVSSMIAEQRRLANMRDSSLYWIEYTARRKHQDMLYWLMPIGGRQSMFVNFGLDTIAVCIVCVIGVVRCLL